MATTTTADGLQTRQRILEAASELFQTSGFEGTPVSKIAKASGMTTANVYWHFPSKHDVLHHVLNAMYSDFFTELTASVPDGPASVRLDRLAHAYVTIQLREATNPKVFTYATLTASLPEDAKRDLGRGERLFMEFLIGVLRQGENEGTFVFRDATVTAFAISTLCEHVFTWYRPDGRLTTEEVGDIYSELVLKMVSPRDSTGT